MLAYFSIPKQTNILTDEQSLYPAACMCAQGNNQDNNIIVLTEETSGLMIHLQCQSLPTSIIYKYSVM